MDAINYDLELRRAGANATQGWRKVWFLARRHVLGSAGLFFMLIFVLAAAFADRLHLTRLEKLGREAAARRLLEQHLVGGAGPVLAR